MRVVPDVVVVDAREPVLRDAPVARALVVLGLQGLERGPVLDTQAAQVAEADRLARALQAARALGHRILAGVRQLVLDIAVAALLRLQCGHPVARFLDLCREGHDGQELRLRFGEGLAGPDRRQVQALEERIDGVGGAPTLRGRLDHGRCADAYVAGPKDARPPGRERDRVRLESLLLCGLGTFIAGLAQPAELGGLADGQQHAVARDDELCPGCGFRPPSARGVRGTERHPDELDPGHLGGRLVHDDPGGAGLEDRGDAFLDRLVDLARGRHVLHVAPVHERDLAGALADRRPRAVHGREAASDDDDALARVLRVRQPQGRGAQVLQPVDHSVPVLVGDAQLVGVVAADGDDDGVEALHGQVVEREVLPKLRVADHLAAQSGDRFVLGFQDLNLGQAVLGDAIAEHAAGRRVALEDGHVVAGQEQVERGAHAGGP